MHSTTVHLSTELDILYGLYNLALDHSTNINATDSFAMTQCLDIRQRLLTKTQSSSKKATTLLKKFNTLKFIPSNERALVEQKRLLVEELLKKIKLSEHQMMHMMHLKMKSIRTELAGIHQKKSATRAYLKASPNLLSPVS